MPIVITDQETKQKVADYVETTGRVKRLLIERLSLPLEEGQIADDCALFGLGLGLDSVDTLEIAVGIEQEFGIQVQDEDMMVFRSILSVVEFIIQKNKEKVEEPVL